MRVDRRRRRQPHGLADLAHRRGIAPLALAVRDEVEDLQPFSAQHLGHRLLLLVSTPASAGPLPGGEHQFVTYHHTDGRLRKQTFVRLSCKISLGTPCHHQG